MLLPLIDQVLSQTASTTMPLILLITLDGSVNIIYFTDDLIQEVKRLFQDYIASVGNQGREGLFIFRQHGADLDF